MSKPIVFVAALLVAVLIWLAFRGGGSETLAQPDGVGPHRSEAPQTTPVTAASRRVVPDATQPRAEPENPDRPSSSSGNWFVSGRVLTTSGTPIAGATVAIGTVDFARECTTGEDGAYRLELRWGRGDRAPRLDAFAAGYQPARVQLSRISENETRDVKQDIELRPGGTVVGQVRSGDEGVANARVHVFPDGKTWNYGRIFWTDAHGRFIASAHPGRLFMVQANHGAYGSGGVGPVMVKETPTDVGVIALDPDHLLSGRLVYADGTPAAQLDVAAMATVPGGASTKARQGTTRTDSQGVFRLAGLEPGEYRLTIPARVLESKPKRTVLTTERYVDSIVVEGHRLRLEVGNAEGRSIDVRWVLMIEKDGEQVEADDDSMGRLTSPNFFGFSLPKMERLVAPGSTWKVSVTCSGKSHAKTVRADPVRNETRIAVTLAPR